MSKKLIIKKGDSYRLTKAGFSYVTKLLEEGGYFPEIDMAGFSADKTWAGIMGTHMVEACGKYLREKAEIQEELDEDELAEVAIVGLYCAIAEEQVKDSIK